MRSWPKRIVLGLVLLEVAYLIAGNTFLRTEWGRGAINRKPDKLTAAWASAWTSLPGLVHVRRLDLEGTSRRVAWRGSMARGHAWIWLPSLVGRHFRVVAGTIEGVEVEVEVEVEVDPLTASDAPPRGRGRGWRTTLGGMRIDDLRRLRVADYELAGSGEIRGRARFQVRGPMELRIARLVYDDAAVISRGTEVARRVVLDAAFETEPYRFAAGDLHDLLAGISGSLELRAEADSLGFLAAYLSRVRWLRLGGFGDLTLTVAVERGTLLHGSSLSLTGPEVEAHFFDFSARGAGRLEGSIGAEGRAVRLGAVLTEFSLHRLSDGASILAGEGLETWVTTPSTALHEPPAGLAGRVRLPPARVEDLSVFEPYLPPGLELRIDGGHADLSAELTYDTVDGSGGGRIALEARDVTGTFGDATFTLAMDVEAEIPDLDLLAGRYDLAGTSVQVESARLVRQGVVKGTDWWGRVRIPEGRVTLPPAGEDHTAKTSRAASVVAEVEAELRDSAPVVVLMEQRLPSLHLFDRLLTLPEIEMTGTLIAEGTALGLHAVHVTGGGQDQLEIRTELDLEEKKASGVAYVRYRALDATLALHRGDREWELVRARRKYEQAAAEYAAARDLAAGAGGG